MTVIIQAGHLNIESNCDPALRSGSGAPGEAAWTPRIASRIVDLLNQQGVDARVVDANFNCVADAGKDYMAVVAIHYQANLPTESGFFVGAGDPAQGKAAAASASLVQQIKDAYARDTGLVFRPEWNSDTIVHYYLLEKLSTHSPSCLVEAGVGWGPDRDFLHSSQGMETVSQAIARGVASFVKAAAPAPTPPPPGSTPTVEEVEAENARLHRQPVNDAEQLHLVAVELATARSRIKELQRELDDLTSVLQQLTKLIRG